MEKGGRQKVLHHKNMSVRTNFRRLVTRWEEKTGKRGEGRGARRRDDA